MGNKHTWTLQLEVVVFYCAFCCCFFGGGRNARLGYHRNRGICKAPIPKQAGQGHKSQAPKPEICENTVLKNTGRAGASMGLQYLDARKCGHEDWGRGIDEYLQHDQGAITEVLLTGHWHVFTVSPTFHHF